MSENKKEESFEEIKTRLREELNDLYERYGLDMVKLVVDEDDLHRVENAIIKRTRETAMKI
jgi:ATP/maltotriose-dependent transcriptional regulator MalT